MSVFHVATQDLIVLADVLRAVQDGANVTVEWVGRQDT